jgi:hypothetical protein
MKRRRGEGRLKEGHSPRRGRVRRKEPGHIKGNLSQNRRLWESQEGI